MINAHDLYAVFVQVYSDPGSSRYQSFDFHLVEPYVGIRLIKDGVFAVAFFMVFREVDGARANIHRKGNDARDQEEKQAYGIKTTAGRVLVPPAEYDPETGDATGDFVEVGPGGVVKSWSWIDNPKPKNHLQEPFAWALVELDGADTALLQAVRVDGQDAMSTGMRVEIKWADETRGCIQDIECFVPEEGR